MVDHLQHVPRPSPEQRARLAQLLAEKGIEASYPLSYPQRQLWLAGLQAGQPVYDVPLAFRLNGPVSVRALGRSIDELVRRHASLRTALRPTDGGACQVVYRTVQIDLAFIDVAALPAPSEELGKISRRHARWRFDLERAPLLRFALVRLARDEHVLLCVFHHIICDAWSLGIVFTELELLYRSFATGVRASLIDRSRDGESYADFVGWQRRRERTEFASQLEYWKKQLAGAPRMLGIPPDRARPVVQSFRGDLVSFDVPGPCTDSLMALSRSEGCSLFVSLLASFLVLLRRYSSSADVAVGLPVANRGRAAFESLVGALANTVVLRCRVDGHVTFRQFLTAVRRASLEAQTHQELPFEVLVDSLKPDRDPGANALFQVLFIYQEGEATALRLDDARVAELPVHNGTSKFDLTLGFTRRGGVLLGAFEYATDLYERRTIEEVAEHLRALLAAIAVDPDRPVAKLAQVSGERLQRALEGLRGPRVELGRTDLVHTAFEARAAERPDAVALVGRDRHWTYREVHARSNQLARYLREKLGLCPDDVVALHLGRSPESVVAMLGVLKAGAAYLPLDPSHPRERLLFALRDSGAVVLLTTSARSDWAAWDGTIVDLVADRAAIEARERSSLEATATAANLAYVIYTSGSTGQPKGVMVAHRNVVGFFAGMNATFGEDEAGALLAVTSTSFDISVLELLWTLGRGFSVVLNEGWPVGERALADEARARTRDLEFSLFYFASAAQGLDAADRYRLLVEGARFADQRGFSAVWTPERHFHSFGGLYPNPAVTGAAVAMVTERIQIRAGSVVMPLNDPLRVAEEWSVVDNLSGGRVAVSFASGWHRDDFVLAPERYDDRKAFMVRGLREVQKLWRGEKVRRRGTAGTEVEVGIYPPPVQAELPLWLTAAGNPETFRIAGELGANVLTHLVGQSVDELARKIAVYREALRANHRGEGHVSLMLHTFVADGLETAQRTAREPLARYLRDSFDLIGGLTGGLDADRPAAELEDRILLARDRLLANASLIGGPEECAATLESLAAIGVDEIACLIDFGIEIDTVLGSLPRLDEVRARFARPRAVRHEAEPPWSHRITHLQCTPSLARLLVEGRAGRELLGGLERLLVGGDTFPAALAQRLSSVVGGSIHNLYGPTETAIWSSAHELDGPGTYVPIGAPITNTQFYIVDEGLEPVPRPVAGELLIGGEGVARGYLGSPGLTAERFVPDPFGDQRGARLFRTGDLARRYPEGVLQLLGRIDDQVKIHGNRVELGEVEALLGRHPCVRQVVVAVREYVPSDPRLVAYCVTEGPGPRALRAVRADDELGPRRYTLKNGMVIAHLSEFQTALGYREVVEDDSYFRHGIALRDGDCVFDVGANIGLFTLLVHQRCKGLRVHAFEPIPEVFDVLRRNVERYGLGVELHGCGLSDRSTHKDFTYYPEMSGLSGCHADPDCDRRVAESVWHSRLREMEESARPSEADLNALFDVQFRGVQTKLPVRTLSEIMRERGVDRIDLLKIDVERSEVEVLHGIEEQDWPRIQQIVLEVDTRENMERVETILRARGYRYEADCTLAIPAGNGRTGVELFLVYARRADSSAGVAPVRADFSGPAVVTAGELRSYLRERIPEFLVPSAFVFLDALPLTGNGKVDRRALPAPSEDPPGGVVRRGPANELEREIAEVWREALNLDEVGADDSFFDLGGNSFLLAFVYSRLVDRFPTLTLPDLIRYPTVSSLAAALGCHAPPRGGGDADWIAGQRRRALERRRAAARRRE